VTRSVFLTFGFVIFLFWSAPAISLHADPSPEDQAKISSLKERVSELYWAGKFAEAIPIAQESLELTEKALGPEHPDTATALNTLGALYYSMGDYAKAEPLDQRALKIFEKALGHEHPDVTHGDDPGARNCRIRRYRRKVLHGQRR
jgi:tetratricopeptide (TPR) repeat protein